MPNHNMTLTTELQSECNVCAAYIEFDNDVEINELIECLDCGTEYEVISINPLQIEEAPMEAEDWGQ